jgi:hypothetical protein
MEERSSKNVLQLSSPGRKRRGRPTHKWMIHVMFILKDRGLEAAGWENR